MDYSQFRQTSNKGAAVSVNHRALITRALTKYPVDYALFRELLQNSADAQSHVATIEFETSSTDLNLAQIHNLPIVRLRFTNDGADFTKEDWNRLREIASGNPNETKIGAFGVGFYSVFELTEEPLVHSGSQIMNFEYQGIQLHYHFTDKAPSYQKGTLIDLPYRTEGSLPDLVKFVGFLVQSFSLINLNEVNVVLKYANGKAVSLLRLSKSTATPIMLDPLKGGRTKSPHGLFKLAYLQTRNMRMSLRYLNATQMPPLSLSKGFFSFGKQLVTSLVTDSGNPGDYTEATFELAKVDAYVDVSVSTSYRNKMIETLLKPPPKQAVMSLISYTTPLHMPKVGSQLQSYVFPKEPNDAKIFIGFPTKQSTGIRSHLGLNQVIPTMERTAVDMSNQFVKDWNGEMLYMAGVMARTAYENELFLCKSRGSAAEDSDFVYSRFRFSSSAPDAIIGLYIKEGFWKCSTETLVPSTKGLVSNSEARVADDSMDFLRMTPMVTNIELSKDLQHLNMIREISFAEIASDTRSSAFDLSGFKGYIKWLAGKWPHLDSTNRALLLTAARLKLDSQRTFDFGSIRWYHDRSKLPDDEVANNLPSNCLPSGVASEIGMKELSVLGVRPLTTEDWVKFRLSSMNPNGANLSKVAGGVLQVAAKSWARLPFAMRQGLLEFFNSVQCIPTQEGLKLPQESYVKPIAIFPRLPIVSKDLELPLSWLREIGVRESIAMSLVFQALNEKQLAWTNEDLINYLSEISESLQPNDWKVLQTRQFFSAADGSASMYRANELYAPSQELRQLRLPVLSFKNWSSESSQAKLLFKIGLQQFPSPQTLFKDLKDDSDHEFALKYFVKHYEEARYSSKHIAQLDVIPTTTPGVYVKPSECYWDKELLTFGVGVLNPRWQGFTSYLGVQRKPTISSLLARVLKSPETYLSDASQCDKIFAYFAQNIGDFNDTDIKYCRGTRFIPIRDDGLTTSSKRSALRWEKPSSVFLPFEGEERDDADFMRPLLSTFHPSQQSRPFLIFIGVSDRPTLAQAVQILVKNPAKVFELVTSSDVYEYLLNQIEVKWSLLSQNEKLVSAMKTAPFLLGLTHKKGPDGASMKAEVSLYSAAELAIVDDVVIFNQFKDRIVTAPQDETIERLYRRLGVPKLSELMRESVSIGAVVFDEEKRKAHEQIIRERLALFLENTSKTRKPLSKNIDVELVNSLEVHRKMPPHSSVSFHTSACMHPTITNKLLIVTGGSFDWIDVASALIKSVLVKPDQDSIVVLEIQLSSDLDTLEKKGYNIQRIRSTREKKKTLPKVLPVSPGFRESPDNTAGQKGSDPVQVGNAGSPLMKQPPSSNPTQNTRSSGAGNTSVSQPVTRSPAVPNQTGPPASSQKQRTDSPTAMSAFINKYNSVKKAFSTSSAQHTQTQAPDVRAQLQHGLERGKSFSDSQLHAPQHVDTPSPMSDLQCSQPQKIHHLKQITVLENGIKVYATAANLQAAQDELVLSESLLLLCRVFNYSEASVNIYRDTDRNSIAFNYNGSIFFNSMVNPAIDSLLDYYYPVMAHELAHNLVSPHGSSHSFYTESYIQTSLATFVRYR